MDSEELFESDDENNSKTDVMTDFCHIDVDQFSYIIQEILTNDKISDATEIFYQVFLNILKDPENFHAEYGSLSVLASCAKCLKYANKFNSVTFANLLTNDILEVPLEFIWWLQTNEIMYIAECRYFLQHINIPVELLNILKRSDEHEVLLCQKIVQDILIHLIRGCHRPHVSTHNLYISTVWSTFCMKVINQLVDHMFQDTIEERNDGCLKLLSLVTSSRTYLPSIVLRLIFKNILLKFMTHTKEFNVYSSFTYQELWCSKHISYTLKHVFEEIFTEMCNMNDIIDIVEENDLLISWKYTMIAVGVCIQKSTTGICDANDICLKYFDKSLKGGKISIFLKGLLLIRQACLEDMNFSYKTWYAQTFGVRTNYKATRNISFYKFFLSALTKLIPYEPESYLKAHIEQAMYVPATCNTNMHDYKNLCRARLEELKKSSVIEVEECNICILHLIEETNETNDISQVLVDIITKHHSDFKTIVLPYILNEKVICKKILELLISNNYISVDYLNI